jgi:Protein of unknown function (DUF4254)
MTEQVADIAALQVELTRAWHVTPARPVPATPDLLRLVGENHRRNFELWHTEDEARRDDLGSEHVHRAKRTIDRLNQERNDFIQQIDEWVVANLRPPTGGCPLHSETPGMMIDRLSILALKTFHMTLEAGRADASAEHRHKALLRVAVLEQQLDDLQTCLQTLLEDIGRGRRTFRVYFQFKMYNDPTLNPALYGRAKTGA